jgi:hypothetical protein
VWSQPAVWVLDRLSDPVIIILGYDESGPLWPNEFPPLTVRVFGNDLADVARYRTASVPDVTFTPIGMVDQS